MSITAPAAAHPVWLVRHASTAWTGRRWCGREDPPLTFAGRREARELAVRLRPELPPGTLIRTSPLRRAVATAGAIASLARLPLEVDPDLIEVDVGRIQGLTWGEVEAREPATASALLAGGDVDWPGGETVAATRTRAGRVVERLDSLRGVRPVVLVSHGAFLHALASMLAADGEGTELLGPAGLLRLAP
jgi:ribonuclease H / adenosylcobalamin/alpha-ribazole phosphatase